MLDLNRADAFEKIRDTESKLATKIVDVKKELQNEIKQTKVKPKPKVKLPTRNSLIASLIKYAEGWKK